MADSILGLLAGGFLGFSFLMYDRWKNRYIFKPSASKKDMEDRQWQNMMNYNGTERGQNSLEN